MNNTYPCVQCGLCCQKVDKVTTLKGYDRGDGVSHHLNNSLCGIYDQRPLICNVALMYDVYFSKEMDMGTFSGRTLLPV
jgi:Fe-S-cluster containining protein